MQVATLCARPVQHNGVEGPRAQKEELAHPLHCLGTVPQLTPTATRHARPFASVLASLASASLLTGCFGFDDALEDALEDLEGLEVCGDMTLEELSTADEISEECRADIEQFLPEEQESFSGRLVSLGSDTTDDGRRQFFVHGATDDGAVIDVDAFANATITATIDGETTELPPEAFTITRVDAGEIISLSLVNDYSASMLDRDLAAVEQIHDDMFTYLPPAYEAEVVQFSETVDVRQAYTTDADSLGRAVARDEGYERSSTALYDGMGVALDNLVQRDRPVRILMVSTDGAENASTAFDKPELVDTIRSEGVVVVMLGALLADVSEMRDLTAGRGVVFYTHYYSDLRAQMQAYIESLGEVAQVELTPDYADATNITINVGGISTSL
jgi:hypothetical protein